jgi:hypothetical protein
MNSRASARSWRAAAMSSQGLNQPMSSRATWPRRRCSRGTGERLGEQRLGAVLAEAEEFHRGGEERRERRVAHAGKDGGQRGAEDAAFEGGGDRGGAGQSSVAARRVNSSASG